MEKFIVLFLVCLTSIVFALGDENICDYTFGDPSWDYSRVFYNTDIEFPVGAKTHTVILPAQKGLMISYVCVKLPDEIDQDTTLVAYHPLEREVSIGLPKAASEEFSYHVTAKRHGF